MLSDSLVPKVCDLGFSSSQNDTQSRRRGGTPAYMAPEVAREQLISNYEAVDCYGFGCIAHDVAHVNTDAEAGARLRAAGVTPSAGVAPLGAAAVAAVAPPAEAAAFAAAGDGRDATLLSRSSNGPASSSSLPVRGGGVHVLFQRELDGYVRNVDARVPPPLADLINVCLAVDPAMRPTLAAARLRLVAAAADAPAWV